MSFQSSEAISTSSCAEVRTLVPLKPWDEKTAALHACLKLIQNNPYSKKKFTWPFSKKIQATWSFIRPNLEAFWPVDPRRPPAKGWILHIYIYIDIWIDMGSLPCTHPFCRAHLSLGGCTASAKLGHCDCSTSNSGCGSFGRNSCLRQPKRSKIGKRQALTVSPW